MGTELLARDSAREGMALSPEISVRDLYLESCKRNDIHTVRHILLVGADVNWKNHGGDSGLYIAARNNYGDLLELILTQTGVNVNIVNEIYDHTPLMVACLIGHENIVRRLCQAPGIELNRRNVTGLTALYFAVDMNSPRCVEVLRGAGDVDWNVRTEDGESPLTMAVEDGYADVLQTILSVPEPHLDLSVTDERGRNVAQIAVEENGGDRQRCVEILSRDRRVNWNIKNSEGDTPVMFCVKNNKIEMARCLINTPGVDLDTMDRDGKYLETVARERDLSLLSLVCRANTDNIADRIPECPVCFERFRGQSQVFQCEQGHFICGDCRPRVQNCPTCRGRMLQARCHGAEQILQSLYM